MNSKNQHSQVIKRVAALRRESKEEAKKLLALLPLIRRSLGAFDRGKLQAAGKENESINRDLDDKTEQLLELCLDNPSQQEMEKIRPALNELHNLKMISQKFSNFMEELKIRIAENIMFSDRAYGQLDYLWQSIDEIFRQITAIPPSAGKARSEKIISRCRQLSQLMNQYDIEHEERLIRGICPIKASSMYLNMLDSIRGIVRYLNNTCANL